MRLASSLAVLSIVRVVMALKENLLVVFLKVYLMVRRPHLAAVAAFPVAPPAV